MRPHPQRHPQGEPGAFEHRCAHQVCGEAMRADDVEVDVVRLIDHDVKPGITSDEGDGDELAADPEPAAGRRDRRDRHAHVARSAVERGEAGARAHGCAHLRDRRRRRALRVQPSRRCRRDRQRGRRIRDHRGGPVLVDIGYTVPGQAWTYWNMGPGRAPSCLETDHKHDWSEQTGRTGGVEPRCGEAGAGGQPDSAPRVTC